MQATFTTSNQGSDSVGLDSCRGIPAFDKRQASIRRRRRQKMLDETKAEIS